VRSPPEGGHHAADRFVEYDTDRGLKDPTAEFEVHEKVHLCPLPVIVELPLIIEVSEWASPVTHLDALRPLERHVAGEVLAKWTEPDCEIGNEFSLGSAADAGSDAPRKELRILFDIGDQIEQLVRTVWDNLALRVRGH
jgi:hypothetical protein